MKGLHIIRAGLMACLFGLSIGSASQSADNSPLSQRQQGITQRYQKLEELLLRLADMEATENPERAALLRRAARQSRDKFILQKLKTRATKRRR